MRQAARPRITRAQSAKIESVPAPIGGWNARDPIAEMDDKDAVTLINWFPTPSYCTMRGGSFSWATGLPDYVKTLLPYSGASKKLFAVSGSGIYDITSSGAVGAAVKTGLSNTYGSYVNFSTAAGNYLYFVNGADAPILYDGTNWRTMTSGAGQTISSITHSSATATLTTTTAHVLQTGDTITVTGASPSEYNVTNAAITVTGATTFTYTMGSVPATDATSVGTYTFLPAISGVTLTSLVTVTLFKQRLFFIEAGTLHSWYLPVNSIAGAASKIDLGSVFKRGGTLTAMGVWTIDGGSGLDDYAVWVTSEGEIAVFKGTDPSSSATWSLVGVFQMGAPMGRRCFAKYGGELLYISRDGLVPLSRALQSTRVNSKVTFTDKIQSAISDATTVYAANTGWQVQLYPASNALLLNIPISSAVQVQYVMNTITGSWCQFTGWNATCWELYNDQLYFGTNGSVILAWSGNREYTGDSVTGEAIPAFQYFGNHSQLKYFTGIRPIFLSDGQPTISLGLEVDYSSNATLYSISFPTTNASVWDTALWDAGIWSGDISGIEKQWQSVAGCGYSAAAHIKVVNNGTSLRWASIDYMYQAGGVL